MAQFPVNPKFPEEKWDRAKAEKYGYNTDRFKSLSNYITGSTRFTGVMVIVNGEDIFHYGSLDRISYIASCRKSIISMMYGKYVEDGTIDLGKTVGELGIDDIGGLLPSEKEATIQDLITARSGVYHPASNAGDTKDKPERGSKKHGEYYIYNNWDFNVAGTVFEQLTGKNIFDAFWQDIGSRIGLQDWNRERHKKSGDLTVSIHPAYHFHFSTRDMARIGYLMLREGNWDGEQVISKEWVKRITSPASTYEEVNPKDKGRYSYGYMWWLFDPASPDFVPELEGAYTARGAMGQYITVIPKLDMVLVCKTEAIFKRRSTHKMYLNVLQRILEARL